MPQENLVEKTKRRLGLKRGISDFGPPNIVARTKTSEMLERTSSRLRLVVSKQSQLSSSPSSSSFSSRVSARTTKTSKWQHTLGAFETWEPSSSTSDSSPLQLKAPLATPNPLEMYIAGDEKQYFRVNLTDPNGPNFLPSEARRINTPPLSRSSKARGFFFDYQPPPLDESNDEPFKSRVSRRATSERESEDLGGERERRVSPTEWYNQQLESIEVEDARERFVAEVPDHLANSPLCPRHPKHKSKGKGHCPVHGRKETESSVEEGTATPKKRGWGSEVHEISY